VLTLLQISCNVKHNSITYQEKWRDWPKEASATLYHVPIPVTEKVRR